jgi:hypothetical protein
MTMEEKLIKNKLGLIKLAEQLGNVYYSKSASPPPILNNS